MSTVLAIDHVILSVRDLEAEAARLNARYGLVSVEGGRHPAWGTANWIVPLGDGVPLPGAAAVRHRGGPASPAGWATTIYRSP